jgi:hypothetical protein
LGSTLRGRDIASPLLARAWVFQEKLLSRRAVFFAKSEILWQCQERVRCECRELDSHSAISPQVEEILQAHPNRALGPPQMAAHEDYGRLQRRFAEITSGRCTEQQARDFWLEVVTEYSSMALTRESDRPYAVAGVARRIRGVTRDRYFVGLWLEDLPRGLLWRAAKQSSRGARRRPGIPSWSWMSRTELEAKGAPLVRFASINDFHPDPRLRVMERGTFYLRRLDVDDDFGPVAMGQVGLIAAVRRGVVIPPKHTQSDALRLRLGSWHSELAYWDCPFDGAEPVHAGDVVYCVTIGTSSLREVGHSLILRAGHRQWTYRRVGMLENHPPRLFEDAPVHLVMIT